MTEHTKGLLVTFEVGDNGSLALGSEDKTSLLTIVEEDGTDFAAIYHAADARRIAACWNACLGLPTDELEQMGLVCAVGNQLLLLEQHRDTLIEALNGVLGVMSNSQGVAGWHKNGDIATWDELLPEVSTALDYVGHPIPSRAEFILGQMMNELQGVMVELDSPGGPVDGSELWERIKAARNRVLIHGALSTQQAQPDTAWTEAATTPTEQDYRELQDQHDQVQSRLKGALDLLHELREGAEIHQHNCKVCKNEDGVNNWTGKLARIDAALAGKMPHPAVTVTETIRTAPERIWLQVGDQEHYHSEPFPSDTSEVSWCADSVMACEVPYVRADLASQVPLRSSDQNLLDWAVTSWHEQVAHRPMENVYRRTLDSVWRQVIRFAGEDPHSIIGPSHDDLLYQEQVQQGGEQCDSASQSSSPD